MKDRPTTWYQPHEVQAIEEDGTINIYDGEDKLFECPFDSRGIINYALQAFGRQRGFAEGTASIQFELRRLIGAAPSAPMENP